MMSAIARYIAAIEEMNEWAVKKATRRRQLEALYRGKDRVTREFLIDKDQVMSECQIMLDRATARAAALGPAALLEAEGLK